jgi:hypothetical protein
MARRSVAITNSGEQVAKIKALLDDFTTMLEAGDLRDQVRSLIPAFHALRDLGSGLIPGIDSSAARDRIIEYLRKYPLVLIDGDELLVVSGIGEWARRVRELRVQFGWSVCTGNTLRDLFADVPETVDEYSAALKVDPRSIRPDQYILMSDVQDREAALRWNQINAIRKAPGGVKTKILRLMRENVGRPITIEELRYVAKERNEWPRRIRELRTEDGWPIFTRMQGRTELPMGTYILDEDKQAEAHDRQIPDDVRVAVLSRDGFACTACGWTHAAIQPGDPRKFLELHHLTAHKDKGANTAENLRTLCNVDHDSVHKGRLEWSGESWIKVPAE